MSLPGPVVFIDDELETEGTEAYALLKEILTTGRPVATQLKIPDEDDIWKSWLDQWQSLAFVVLDWDLSPGSGGSSGGATLSKFERRKLYDFLVELMGRIYCPIFIISREDTDDIERQLLENPDLTVGDGELDARLKVFPKDVLMSKIIDHISGHITANPAMSAVKAWELEFQSAKNSLFLELNALEPDWPVYVWRAADSDEVDPAYELASVISVNLLNRFNPVGFDVDAIENFELPANGVSRRRVSQGRTTVLGDRLAGSMAFPGDIFVMPEGREYDDEIWINVSPACHIVPRLVKQEDGTIAPEKVKLHLLRGRPVAWPANAKELDKMNSEDRSNSIVVHTLLDDNPYKFEFGKAWIEPWEEIKDFRKARLLPPYIVRVQQMHAAYMQSQGLPKVTFALYDMDT